MAMADRPPRPSVGNDATVRILQREPNLEGAHGKIPRNEQRKDPNEAGTSGTTKEPEAPSAPLKEGKWVEGGFQCSYCQKVSIAPYDLDDDDLPDIQFGDFVEGEIQKMMAGDGHMDVDSTDTPMTTDPPTPTP